MNLKLKAIFLMTLLALSACSGSGKSSDIEGETQKSPSIGWDDQVFGKDFYADLEASNVSRLFVAAGQEAVAAKRGEYLVKHVGACGVCHDGPDGGFLSGGKTVAIDGQEVLVPGVISYNQMGAKSKSVGEMFAAIKGADLPDAETKTKLGHIGYEWLSDQDVVAMLYYLKSVTKEPYTSAGTNMAVGGLGAYVPAPTRSASAEYGRYLGVNFARCTRCHKSEEGYFSDSEPFVGSERYEGRDDNLGPDIRIKSGEVINAWRESDFITYLKTGKTPGAKQIAVSMCPWNYYKGMTEEDMRAIYKLLSKL
ncbi:MAG: cytochrome c [Deltaproteobacteria bacterium]|nr:cytochrome c [Deltaproteobacteria bacterium]